MKKDLFISIIVPVFNGGSHLDSCLDALLASSHKTFEILVVDDGSTDESVHVCSRKGVKVLQLSRRSGPAAARNYGAQQARGDVLLFVDSDVVVRPDTMAQVAADFVENPDVAAVFGSYDKEPHADSFLSQYKNLYHHFVHQRSSPDAVTFWAGCGAIRRQAFEEVGGFDESRYTQPSIEDIELGYRLHRAGFRILLDKELQVKHLKQWTLISLIRADVFYRAVPWSMLLVENRDREIVNDLNLRTADRICAGLTGFSLMLLPLAVMMPEVLYLILLCWATIIFLNRRLYLFFLKERGVIFAASAFPLQLLYYLYSSVTFALCWVRFRLTNPRAEVRDNTTKGKKFKRAMHDET